VSAGAEPWSNDLPNDAAVATPEPTADQQAALDTVIASGDTGYRAWLLHGITGSGKTEVYLRLTERQLRAGRRVLILVPEIGLTPQLVGRFAKRFAGTPLAVLHSGLTDTQRLEAWRGTHDGSARLVLGTRSAVFAPIPDLGLIVVDEEHDASFKQQEGGFRYSARDLALVRAQQLDIPIVLGSATPSLESLHNVSLGRYHRLSLPRRAANAQPPTLRLIDLRAEHVHAGLSTTAATSIEKHLANQGQVLVYINRRGYAPTLACTACGWVAPCLSCDARLTVYRQASRLRCHHCGADRELPRQCPQCGYAVKTVGQGTERIEESLSETFEGVGIARLDRDVVRRQDELEAVVSRIASGDARILVGTQMIAKGHDFPDVTLVVVLNADQGLFSTDFRAAERLAQTIVQVAGRAGRGDRRGEVLIQTEYPEHPLLRGLLEGGYEAFASAALAEREAAAWPPFARLAALRASALQADWATDFLAAARRAAPKANVRLLGPAPAAMAKRAGRFHAQLLVESADRTALHRFLDRWVPAVEALPEVRRVRWALDVDPLELF
jgi:primosomal protein N' (replication factor Y)